MLIGRIGGHELHRLGNLREEGGRGRWWECRAGGKVHGSSHPKRKRMCRELRGFFMTVTRGELPQRLKLTAAGEREAEGCGCLGGQARPPAPPRSPEPPPEQEPTPTTPGADVAGMLGTFTLRIRPDGSWLCDCEKGQQWCRHKRTIVESLSHGREIPRWRPTPLGERALDRGQLPAPPAPPAELDIPPAVLETRIRKMERERRSLAKRGVSPEQFEAAYQRAHIRSEADHATNRARYLERKHGKTHPEAQAMRERARVLRASLR